MRWRPRLHPDLRARPAARPNPVIGCPAAVVAAVLVLLAGCTTVPTSGEVQEHGLGDDPASSSVRVAPVPPVAGASPMLIVEGFLHAMGTDQAGFEIARQYLTDAAARDWNPDEQITVYADGTPPRETENSVVLSTMTVGTMSAQGEFTQESGRLSHDFALVRDEDDQWRISDPPTGLLISRYDLVNNYSAVDLYYLDLAETALAPDPRYFPQNDSLLASIVREQLAGPGAWLAPAMRPSFSDRLSLERVEVSALGVASVQLSSAALSLGSSERHTLLAELTWTLTQLPDVTEVQVNAGSTPLLLPGSSTGLLTRDVFGSIAPVNEQAANRLFAVQDGEVREVRDPGSWTQTVATAPAISGASALAVRSDLLQFAAVVEDGTKLVTAGPEDVEPTLVATGTELLRPSYSRQQRLWVLESGATAASFMVFGGAENTPLEVVAEDLPGDPVIAFRVSPDGSRMALVVHGTETDQLGIARIVRTQDGVRLQSFRPLSLGTPSESGMRLLDVGWGSATQLLVLVSHADSEQTTSVVRVDQDGLTADETGPTGVSGLLELAVVPTSGQVARPVARSADAVYRSEGDFNWRTVSAEVTAIAYSG